MLINKASKKRKFVIATQDYSGLGFATRLKEEGSNVIMAYKYKDSVKPEEIKKMDFVGAGIVGVEPLEDVIKSKEWKDAYWLWDGNHNTREAKALRSLGNGLIANKVKVFGGTELMDKMEHDRNYGISLIEKAMIKIPETKEFSDVNSGIKFMEANEDKAYVFKPDEPNDEAWTTTVPDSDNAEEANKEIKLFLQSMGNGNGDYILQERKMGVEVNVEAFYFNGKPYFAHINLESKRKENEDLGTFTGCSQDIEHIIDLDAPILKETIYKLARLPEFRDYTGFLDMNVIVGDNNYWFLEFCARFGYNAHPNLFYSLTISPISDIFADMIDGKNLDKFYNHFRQGFGASILLRTDNLVNGLPIIIPKDVRKNFYPYDIYQDKGVDKLAGSGNEVGTVISHDYDLKSAAEDALLIKKKIRYSGKAGRTDLADIDYQSNPYERYQALKEMKII